MELTPSMERFISGWGEMASKWCINRTVAEVHALFFLARDPLSADEVARVLSLSRSNISSALRELESRRLISAVHFRGERKQFYEAITDPLEVFQVILDDHKRRVIDPSVDVFRACLEDQKRSNPEDLHTAGRMREVVELFSAVTPLYEELRHLTKGPVHNLFKITARIRELLT